MTFDLVSTPLDKGVTRLEASAGTGKTFALAGLFLRLLLEAKVSARDILVVTFTEAATAELRERIRGRLSEALAVLEGATSEDPLLVELAVRVRPHMQTAILSLRNALEVFDLVSVSTIHSFCERTLQDSAFESGILFDMELVSDQAELIREAAADYCRKQLHGCDELLASASMYAKLTPDVLSSLLKQYLTYPELRLVTGEAPRPIERIAQELRTTFLQCVDAWKAIPKGREGLVNFFIGGEKWTIGDHAKSHLIHEYAGHLETCLDVTSLSPNVWEAIWFFSSSAVRAETGKKKKLPERPPALLEHCEALYGLILEYTTAHRAAFLRSSGQMLAQRKQEAKQQSFDDLISRLAGALDGASGPALAQSVRRKYRAALIDECQDTDPLQWRIFENVFAHSPDHWLYLIGDPKQAIYGFRGADVNTYLQAAATAKHKYTLGTNWRSESALVHAVNALFSSAGRTTAFLEKNISFDAASPGPQADQNPLLFPPNDLRPAPFHVWCWESSKGAVTLGKAKKQLPFSVAAEISRLLNLKVLLGERRIIQPRDIAILVESHKQAGWMQSALHDLGIASVEQAMESVFESNEARELQWIMAAVLAPGREASVKSALTTDALGLTGSKLQALVSDESRWQSRLQGFARYRQIWEEDGFFSMFTQLLRQEQVLENLLRYLDAERRITNLLHVAELLEAACKAEHLGPSRLVQWLEERRISDEAAPDAFQLRLESDEDAVQIVTIHRAKGLQYPVVFCPFVSKDAKLRQINVNRQKVLDVVLYHDGRTEKLTWDLSPEPEETHIQLAAREQLAEKVRLLYVALTRACNRCYLVSARYTRNKSTALAWLMHRPSGTPDDPVAALNHEIVAPGAWKSRWNKIAAAAAEPNGGAPGMAVEDLPLDPGKRWIPSETNSTKLAARCCARRIDLSWFLSSFTQLAGQVTLRQSADAEGGVLDHDETALASSSAVGDEEVTSAPEGIFALPASARTGDCLHKILERFDFAAADAEATQALVRQQLEASNLWNAPYAAAVVEMLERLRHVPLEPGNPNLTLAGVPVGRRLTELEFQFPTTGLDAKHLLELIRNSKSAVRASGRPAGGLPLSRIEAFLKGFIDLVFVFEGRYHIIDWKSNLLGNRTEDYTQEAMRLEIMENCYDLQYHLYIVALDKFLRQRLAGYSYDTHFGGVHYVFLRGLDPARPDLGIFHDRPSADALTRLTSELGIFAEGHS
jgi:exodeoxyribonuclease V beta subunit